MLSSCTWELAGAPDGYNAFFLVESFPETLGYAVVLEFLKELNIYANTR